MVIEMRIGILAKTNKCIKDLMKSWNVALANNWNKFEVEVLKWFKLKLKWK